eukprot:TRINITY_DN7523_c1_g1_i1.p1 TRINITY_DN7523_c1_g1~~TRINITY_DN7523_c1_g1_i1.p1  ORF type:complete len:197 (-),score=13.83 TRINITY_DN7523_c1_g1_i1:63-653(-)
MTDLADCPRIMCERGDVDWSAYYRLERLLLLQVYRGSTDMQVSLDELVTNEDASRAGLLKMNLQEARDKLRLRLAEVDETAGIVGIGTAVEEARLLVSEVDSEFGFRQRFSSRPAEQVNEFESALACPIVQCAQNRAQHMLKTSLTMQAWLLNALPRRQRFLVCFNAGVSSSAVRKVPGVRRGPLALARIQSFDHR